MKENTETPIIVDVGPKPPPPEKTENEKYADGLRALADFYQQHPEMPLPYGDIQLFPNGKEELAVIARAMRTFKKSFSDEMIYLRKTFGPVNLVAMEYRKKVCKPRVVGTETVKVKKPVTFEEVEETRDILEWDCHEPVLKDAKQIPEEQKALEAI